MKMISNALFGKCQHSDASVHFQRFQGFQLLFRWLPYPRDAVYGNIRRHTQVPAYSSNEVPVPGIPAYRPVFHRSRPSMITRIPHDEATSSSSLHPFDNSQAGIM